MLFWISSVLRRVMTRIKGVCAYRQARGQRVRWTSRWPIDRATLTSSKSLGWQKHLLRLVRPSWLHCYDCQAVCIISCLGCTYMWAKLLHWPVEVMQEDAQGRVCKSCRGPALKPNYPSATKWTSHLDCGHQTQVISSTNRHTQSSPILFSLQQQQPTATET